MIAIVRLYGSESATARAYVLDDIINKTHLVATKRNKMSTASLKGRSTNESEVHARTGTYVRTKKHTHSQIHTQWHDINRYEC